MTDRDWARRPTITPEAKSWLVSVACDKAKEHGYPHELWTTRLLAMKAALASVGLNQYLLVDRIYYFGARVFLTASEVAQLKLNADWVVLSACNTIAGESKLFEGDPTLRTPSARAVDPTRTLPRSSMRSRCVHALAAHFLLQ